MPPARENTAPSGADEHPVMGQDVQRAVISEGVVESGRKDQHVGGEHTAGVVGHHQRTAAAGQGREAVDLGAEVPLDERSDEVLELLGEDRVPLGGFLVIGHGSPSFGATVCRSLRPSVASRLDADDRIGLSTADTFRPLPFSKPSARHWDDGAREQSELSRSDRRRRCFRASPNSFPSAASATRSWCPR